MSSWMYNTFKQKVKKVWREVETAFSIDLMRTIFFFSPSFTYTDLVVTKVADTASDEGDATDKACEIADVPTSFKLDMWKHFGFAL